MKKRGEREFTWRSFLGITGIMLCFFALSMNFLITNKPQNQTINLSNFSGRIIPQNEIRPGTFTINVSLREALKWGEDAILSYGGTLRGGGGGVEVWKPDPITPGVFQNSKIKTSVFYPYDVYLRGNNLMINYYIDKGTIILSSIMTILIWLLILGVYHGWLNKTY